jgi:hypothetical protein
LIKKCTVQAEGLKTARLKAWKVKKSEKDALKMHKTRKLQVFESLRIRLILT